MTFKLEPNPTFWAPVDIPVPGGEPQRLELQFRHMSRERGVEFGESMTQRPLIECVLEVVSDWRGVDATFTADALRQLDRDYWSACETILRAYVDELRGARRKN